MTKKRRSVHSEVGWYEAGGQLKSIAYELTRKRGSHQLLGRGEFYDPESPDAALREFIAALFSHPRAETIVHAFLYKRIVRTSPHKSWKRAPERFAQKLGLTFETPLALERLADEVRYALAPEDEGEGENTGEPQKLPVRLLKALDRNGAQWEPALVFRWNPKRLTEAQFRSLALSAFTNEINTFIGGARRGFEHAGLRASPRVRTRDGHTPSDRMKWLVERLVDRSSYEAIANRYSDSEKSEATVNAKTVRAACVKLAKLLRLRLPSR